MEEDLRALARQAVEASTAASDPDYPLFHVAPPVGRLNDPNGLVVHRGVYHAFYQFSPFHPDRKLVYWGHSTSTDLTTWEHREAAIIPDSWYDRNGAYSGNAVVDRGTVHLNYTGNVRPSEEERDTHQCVVTSTDLVTFTKSPRNPLIPEPPHGHTRHVRDPQVWRDDDGSFRMCLGAQRQDLTGCALLYRSPDLTTWEFEGELSFPETPELNQDFGYMWECPAIVRVPDADADKIHDVLLFCPQGISPSREGFKNIFPTCYVVGELHGNQLRNTGDFHELDRGFEFYAPQVFAREPGESGPTLMTAWVGNASEDHQPSMEHGWVHTLSVIRELTVKDGRLIQTPHLDTSRAHTVTTGLPGQIGPTKVELEPLNGRRSFRAVFTVEADQTADWGLRLGTETSHVDFLFSGGQLTVDRSTTRYPHGNQRTVTLPQTSTMTVELIHDRSVTELFLANGALSFTLRSYLEEAPFGVQMWAAEPLPVQFHDVARFTPSAPQPIQSSRIQ
ncbi:glycoside hydrolase family 32 protein [Kocuria sp. ZOR0020]|uniref:glycoside hydrolase family 32 protein n=1 Tax=Kocuria sp. ZOR0020 TaxID=1339234 RepID=UPI0006482B29|nr:glycoside hydrolase family 32 protein [Kocuria sp. ZOR0020]